MTELDLTHVYTVGDLAEAQLVKDALDGEGIPCVVEGENQGGFAGVLSIRLLVPAAHVESARAYLIALEDRFSDEEE